MCERELSAVPDNVLPRQAVAKPIQRTTEASLPQIPLPQMRSYVPPFICLTVAMVTISTPWRQQWVADSKGGEGKVALRDERKKDGR